MPHQRDEAECNRAVCDSLKWWVIGECRISEMKRSAIELCTALFKGTFRKIPYKTRNFSET